MVQSRSSLEPDLEGVRLGHHGRVSPWGYLTCGRESRVLANHQEAQDTTTPMGQR